MGASPAQAGSWVPLDSGTTETLESIHFPVNDQTGYAVGGLGTIIKTTDGGVTWVAQDSGVPTEGLRGVFFRDNLVGFAVGSTGTILRTDDGGTTWIPQVSGTTEMLRAVQFPTDDQTGYIAGYNGTILKTNNGGTTWSPQTTGTTMDLSGMHFPVNDQTGWACGWAGEMLKTINGGATWSSQTSGTAGNIAAVLFPVDTLTGYGAATAGEVVMTTDGGANWTPVVAGPSTQLRSLSFSDADNGYAVGYNGAVYARTAEGWYQQRSGYDDRILDVDFPGGGTTGFAVGWVGTLLKTTDGGGGMMSLHPRSDGSVNNFTTLFNCPTGSWDCVNDQTGNAASGPTEGHDGTGSYLTDEKPNTNREMFALDPGLIPSGATVHTIEILAQVGKIGGPPPTAALGYQRVGTDPSIVDATAVTVSSGGTNQLISNTWTCLNWPAGDIDDLEIGIHHVSGADLTVTQLRVRVGYDRTGTVYRSIGSDVGTRYSTGLVTLNNASQTATFSGGAVIPTDVGAGDRLTVSGTDYYILRRVSDTEVLIQEIPCADVADVAYTIERAHNTLQDWENTQGGKDLVGMDRIEVGVMYNDAAALNGRLTISGATTDASHYMRLLAADGQGHNGLKNTGAGIDAGGGWGGLNAIDVADAYTRIEGLEIKNITDTGSAIYVSGDDGLVDGVFVHSCWQNGNAGVDIDAGNVTVRNSFFTGGTQYGVRLLASATGTIENCTIVGNGSSGSGVTDSAGSTVTVRNTISVDHPTDNDFVLWSNIAFFGNNMYSGSLGVDPGEDDGGHQSPPGDLDTLLVSVAGEDYHLESNGHMAAGGGLDLSASFSTDIDGATRLTPWDIGADDDGSSSVGPGSSTPRILSWREIDPN